MHLVPPPPPFRFIVRGNYAVDHITITSGLTPLQSAAAYGDAAAIDFLVSFGANVDAATHAQTAPPVELAILAGHEAATMRLLRADVCAEHQSSSIRTLLIGCCAHGWRRAARLLVKNLAVVDGVNTPSSDGVTPVRACSSVVAFCWCVRCCCFLFLFLFCLAT